MIEYDYVLDIRVNSNPTSVGDIDSGRAQPAGEGEEIARGFQVKRLQDINVPIFDNANMFCCSHTDCYRSMQHSLEGARLGNFPEEEEEVEGEMGEA